MMRAAVAALAFILAAAFGYLAWMPWVPEADALVRERGVATGIEDRHGAQDTTTFRTDSGATVKLTCGRNTTCKRAQMEALLASQTPTALAHHHGTVYEIDGPLELHVTLQDAKLEWKFPAVLAMAALAFGLWRVFRSPPKPPPRKAKRKRQGGIGDGDSGAEWHVGSGSSSDD